jgi:hypothetical protein
MDQVEVARRTGRFPQLVDPRSRVNGLLLTGSPRFRDKASTAKRMLATAPMIASAESSTSARAGTGLPKPKEGKGCSDVDATAGQKGVATLPVRPKEDLHQHSVVSG